MVLDSSSFPLFHSALVFYKLVCPLAVVLPQIFFHLTTPFSYPVLFCLFCALCDVIHFPAFLRSFRFKSFLFQFPPFVAHVKNIFSDPGFCLLMVFAKTLTGFFSQCCVEGDGHQISACIFIILDGGRCKLPTYQSLEGFQHSGIFQLFKVKLASCVFWLADSFQMEFECHHQQVVVTCNVCCWKASCSGNVHSWLKTISY